MSNAFTIMRRDLSAFFTSTIGYIFIIVFVTISVGLYITSFFGFPVADMRPYFGNLPIMLCVFIPAITMRVWAEEFSENTCELLLTFPMRAWELVIGKFMACLVFLALALAATFTVPVMLISLGDPDNGAIIAGYFGTLLLGGYFLAIGIFFSGFFKDQIVAFVVTLLACFAIFLVGTNFIAAYIDGMLPGWGTLLSELVGLADHYGAFTRGVIEVADILYFIAWTVIFLALNIIFIDGRSRPRARLYFSATVAVCITIGLLCNWIIKDTSLGRFDVTEDKIYTVSDASKSILSDLDTPVQVKLYITPKSEMPTGMTSLEQDISDKLDELRVASGGNIQFTVVHLEVANVIQDQRSLAEEEDEEDEEKALEERMLDKGVQPFSVQIMSEDQVTNKLIYSSMGIGYKDKKEEIIPQIMPQRLPELEYLLVSTIYKLTREKRPVVALVAPTEAVNIPPQMRQIYQQMGQRIPETEDPYEMLELLLAYEKYDFRRVDLTPQSPMPDEYDTLVVINPRSLNDRQRWEINRALVQGKSVVMAVQNYEWDYSVTRGGISPNKRDETPQVNELLEHYGITVDEDILMDNNHVALRVQSGGNSLLSMLQGGQPVKLPMHMLLNNSSMDQETSITARLSSIFYLWGTALTIDEEKLAENGLEAKILMSTSEQAWKVAANAPLTSQSIKKPSDGLEQFPVMALVRGQFPDAYEGKARPAWPIPRPTPGQMPPPPPPDEADAEPVTPAPGKLVLIGCSEMFRKNFLQSAGNMDLFLNSVDAVTLGDDLVNVRGRKPIDRAIDMPSTGTRRWWKVVNYTFSSTIIAVLGIATALLRRRSRNAYTMAYATGAYAAGEE